MRKKKLQHSLHLLLPEYHVSPRTICPHRLRSAFRYTWRSVAVLIAVQVAREVLCILFPGWIDLIAWVGFMATCPLIWLLVVKLIDLNTAGISCEQDCYTLRYSKGFSLHQVIIRPQRIAKIKIVQSILQKRTGRCDVYVFSYSEGRQLHHVRDLNREQAEKLFGIE